jgi:lipoyl-dependent peroxiredoxin
LTADVASFDEKRVRELAEEAKRNCPISKLLNAEMDLTVRIGTTAEA